MDEFFEALTLIQTNKIKKFPVIVFGKEFHQHILAHIEKMVKENTISKEDQSLFLVTNDIQEATEFIQLKTATGLGLRFKPNSWLREK